MMEWTIDPITERPTLATGACTATIWNAGHGDYAATVTDNGMVTARQGFATLEDAQAWCLTQLADLRVAGKCENVTTAADG